MHHASKPLAKKRFCSLRLAIKPTYHPDRKVVFEQLSSSKHPLVECSSLLINISCWGYVISVAFNLASLSQNRLLCCRKAFSLERARETSRRSVTNAPKARWCGDAWHFSCGSQPPINFNRKDRVKQAFTARYHRATALNASSDDWRWVHTDNAWQMRITRWLQPGAVKFAVAQRREN